MDACQTGTLLSIAGPSGNQFYINPNCSEAEALTSAEINQLLASSYLSDNVFENY